MEPVTDEPLNDPAGIFVDSGDFGPDRRGEHRAAVQAALEGAARRGRLGPFWSDQAAALGDQQLRELDLMALSLKAALERVSLPLAQAARAHLQSRVSSVYGYDGLEDYARERLGRTGRWLRDQASLGRALERLPVLADALSGADGGPALGKVGALWVGKVATAETVEGWIALARSVTVRELKQSVRQALEAGSKSPPNRQANAGGAALEGNRDSCSTGGGAQDAAPATDASDASNDATQSDPDEYHQLGIPMPVAARAAFEETLRLHRAVWGRETSATFFAESLFAEAQAGLHPPDVDSVCCVRRRGVVAGLERELAQRSKRWSRLRERCPAGSESALAAETLARFEQLSRRAGRGDTPELDRQLRALIEMEDELERRLGGLLREMNEIQAWRRLSFAGLGHYAEQRLSLGRTAVQGRVRLARALRRYGQLREAYEQGRMGSQSALLVARILREFGWDASTERAWVERAEQATVKRLRDELQALLRDEPAWRGREAATLQPARGLPAQPLDDATWHASLMLRPGQTRRRVHELAGQAVACPGSDVFLRLTLPEDVAAGFLAALESARQRLSAQAGSDTAPGERHGDGTQPTRPTEPASLRGARMFSARRQSVPSWVGLLALLEDFVDTWDLPEGVPKRHADAIYARDGYRCTAPGCTSRQWIEDHHLKYRSRGGDVKAEQNRTCACRFHHQRGVHGNLARCRGQAPLDVIWRLGREDVGVWYRNERRLTEEQAKREMKRRTAS